ncbi:MAG: hypothetical protein M3P51_09100 [Chloroflexota bacterium]|nr:hypothetical protein [Chloroflexota bacterium]
MQYLDLTLRIMLGLFGAGLLGGLLRLLYLAERGFRTKVQQEQEDKARAQQDRTIQRMETALEMQDRTLSEVLERVKVLEQDKITLQTEVKALQEENRRLRDKETELATMRERVSHLEAENIKLTAQVHTLKNELTVALGRLSMSRSTGTTDTIHIATNSVSISEGGEV